MTTTRESSPQTFNLELIKDVDLREHLQCFDKSITQHVKRWPAKVSSMGIYYSLFTEPLDLKNLEVRDLHERARKEKIIIPDKEQRYGVYEAMIYRREDFYGLYALMWAYKNGNTNLKEAALKAREALDSPQISDRINIAYDEEEAGQDNQPGQKKEANMAKGEESKSGRKLKLGETLVIDKKAFENLSVTGKEELMEFAKSLEDNFESVSLVEDKKGLADHAIVEIGSRFKKLEEVMYGRNTADALLGSVITYIGCFASGKPDFKDRFDRLITDGDLTNIGLKGNAIICVKLLERYSSRVKNLGQLLLAVEATSRKDV